MPKEIERKFLVDTSHPQIVAILKTSSIKIRQGYLKSDARGVVRARTYGAQGYLTIKGPTTGITRDEFEYKIPHEDAEAMMTSMCGAVVSKSRYIVPIADQLVIELDVFDDIDLVMAEIELPSEDMQFYRPDWLGEEVSHDPSYYNNAIADHIAAQKRT